MKNKNKKITSIGGQAVIEGVMMRGKTAMATAVRDADGVIRVEAKCIVPNEKKNKILTFPIIRGVVNFFNSLVTGTKILMRSAEVFGEEEQPSKFDNWLANKLKININDLIITISVLLGLAFSVLLFVFCPQLVTNFISGLTKIDKTSFLFNLIEGLVRILIFVCYILLTSLIKDVNRTYMYHGAEHKTISCFESGLPLNKENAMTCTRVHDRCGTTFMFFVMLISILVFSIANCFIGATGIVRMLLKIALLPLVAGLSYELLKALAKTKNPIFYPIKAPGLLLQRITTKEPTMDMLEVAITAFNKVLEMDNDQTIGECEFVTALTFDKLYDKVTSILQNANVDEKSECEWILSCVTGIKRSQMTNNKSIISPKLVEKSLALANERATGKPLWYVIGNCDFYGFTLNVDERVLIPRPETEQLCELALKDIKNNYNVLDLCTGSGAIAITISKKCDCKVFASDISADALSLASENATLNQANVTFINSNLFENINDKFNVIISNPPYIVTEDINDLQSEVKNYEPKLALDGGVDGLDFYRLIAENSNNFLEDNGILFLECGINQSQSILQLLKPHFSSVECFKDFNNIDRFIKAVK